MLRPYGREDAIAHISGADGAAGRAGMEWNYATAQYGDKMKAPHETRKLDALLVEVNRSNPYNSTSWEQLRAYRFTYDFSLYSDGYVCVTGPCDDHQGTHGANSAYRKLTLKTIQRLGSDDSGLPQVTLSYETNRGTSKRALGGWNRLKTVNNGQGGSVTFSYEHISEVYYDRSPRPTYYNLFFNHHRVTKQTLSDGRGNSYATTYAYYATAKNALGYDRDPGTAEHQYPNSATLVYAAAQPNGMTQLAVQDRREFRGHGVVIERIYPGTDTAQTPLGIVEHTFMQGDANCQPANTTDACFLTIREREFNKGRESRTMWKSGSGSVLKYVTHTFATGAPANASGIHYTSKPNRGLWRGFSYETQADEIWHEGGTPTKTRTTRYQYDNTTNNTVTNGTAGSGRFGNLTRVDEFNGGADAERITQYFYAAKDNTTSLSAPNTTYLADRAWGVYTWDDVSGSWQSRAFRIQLYDGQTVPGVMGATGELTRVSAVYDLPLNFTTGTVQTQDTSYDYDQWGNQTSSTSYTGAGSATAVAVSASAPAGWTVNSAGNGSTARTTTTSYDTLFRVFPLSSTNPLGHVEKAAYEYLLGTLIKVIGPNSSSNSSATGFDCGASAYTVASTLDMTCARYDVFGRLIALIKPGDSTTYPTVQALYADSEQPFRYQVRRLAVSGLNGYHETQLFYDGLGRKIQAKHEGAAQNENYVSDWRYDARGLLISASQTRSVVDAASFWDYVSPGNSLYRKTLTSHDGLGRVISVTDPNSKVTTTSYSLGSYATRVTTTDRNNHATAHDYDLFGRLRSVKEYSGPGTGGSVATTSYAYTPLDQLSQVDDAAANRTTMTYDSLGRKTSMDDPDMGAWAYTYDVNGNLKTQTDGKSQVLWFGYDDLDRPTEQRLNSSSGTRLHKHTYDGSGFGLGRRTQLDAFTSGGGIDHRTVWTYDARGRTSQATHTGTSYYSGSKTFSWGYNAADRPITITYPDGDVATTSYNSAGQPATLTSADGGTLVSSASSTPLGQPDSWTFGNGVVQDWTYSNPLARLSQMTIVQGSTTRFNRSYGYDDVGNVTAITNNSGSGNDQTFGYDHRDRLTSWVLDGVSNSYQYNTIGNLTNNAGTAYTYPASGATSTRPHAVSSAGGSYSYDANGNLTSGGGRSYSWNVSNQPTSITSGGVTESYSYNGDGVRTTKTRSGSTTVYLEGLWEQTGGVVKSYYSFNGQVVAVRDSSDTTNYPAYLHGDHLGSVSVVTNSVGGAVTQEFDPWGKVRSGGTSATKRNYTGQYLDDTGLLFYNARYYDPALGRFVSADSIVPGSGALTLAPHDATARAAWAGGGAGPANPQDLNRYSYGLNNPVRNTDPSGHCPVCIIAAGAVIGGIIGGGLYAWNESRQDGLDLHLNIAISNTGIQVDAGSDWGDMLASTGGGVISGALVTNPGTMGAGVGMSAGLVGDHVGNLITGSDFSMVNHAISGGTGLGAGAMNSVIAAGGEGIAITSTAVQVFQSGMWGLIDGLAKSAVNGTAKTYSPSDALTSFGLGAASEIVGFGIMGGLYGFGGAAFAEHTLSQIGAGIAAQTVTTNASNLPKPSNARGGPR